MRILLDQGTPVPLRGALNDHVVATAYELGWSTVTNLRYQQNLQSRSIAILVLTTTSWPRIRAVTGEIRAAVDVIQADASVELPIP